MLIKNDRLGDGKDNRNLKNEEALEALREKNRKDLDKFRWPDQAEMTDKERRRGKALHFTEIIERIRRLNSKIHVEQSINFPDCVGLYVINPIGLSRVYLSYLDKTVMPEFSSIECDWQDLPETEQRGWRTVLVRLLSLGAIPWSGVLKEFGDADPNSPVSRRWFAETKQFRY